MTTTSERKPAAKRRTRAGRKPAAKHKKAERAAPPTSAGGLRARLSLTQTEFARLLAVSPRTLASLEGSSAPSDPVARRLTELERLTAGLSEVLREEAIGQWLRTPNSAFGGSKPLEVVERGEGDRLWEMIYFLRSGVPS